jgi:hypothetical protein
MIDGHLPVPRIALEGEFEIAAPHFVVVEERAGLFRRNVIVESVIARAEAKPIALE